MFFTRSADVLHPTQRMFFTRPADVLHPNPADAAGHLEPMADRAFQARER